VSVLRRIGQAAAKLIVEDDRALLSEGLHPQKVIVSCARPAVKNEKDWRSDESVASPVQRRRGAVREAGLSGRWNWRHARKLKPFSARSVNATTLVHSREAYRAAISAVATCICTVSSICFP
jgi:hypothetical protein